MNAPRPRIYKDRLYLALVPQGISGFPKPAILAVVSGRVYRRDYYTLLPLTGGEGNLNARVWRMEDGHLPDQQPRGTYNEACDFVRSHPYRAAYVTEEPSPR